MGQADEGGGVNSGRSWQHLGIHGRHHPRRKGY
jgi:hypothetical protein